MDPGYLAVAKHLSDVEISEEDWEEIISNSIDYIDENGNLISSQDERFESNKYLIVQRSGLLGILDQELNKFVLAPLFIRIERIDHLNRFLVEKNGKCGLVDAFTWQFLVDCEYDKIELSWNDFSVVSKHNKYGIVKNRVLMLPLEYNEVFVQGDYIFAIQTKKIKMYGLNFKQIRIKPDLTESNLPNGAIIHKFGEEYILVNRQGNILFPILSPKIRITKSALAPFIVKFKILENWKYLYILLSADFRIINQKMYKRMIETPLSNFIADDDLIDPNGEMIDTTYITNKRFHNKKYNILETVRSEYIVIDKNEELCLKVYPTFNEAKNHVNPPKRNSVKEKPPVQEVIKTEPKESPEVYKGYVIKFEYNFWVGIKNGDIKTRTVCTTKKSLIKKINATRNQIQHQNPKVRSKNVNIKPNKNDKLEEVYNGHKIWSNSYSYYTITNNKKMSILQATDITSLRIMILKNELGKK